MTELGIVGDAPPFVVDGAGVIAGRGPLAFELDWWIGAEDRWHRTSREVAVRQSLADAGAVVETRLRIPGGDAVGRVLAVAAGGASAALLQLTNETPVPVAAALVVRCPRGVFSVEGDTVRYDGQALVRAGRVPVDVLVGDDADDLELRLANRERADGAISPSASLVGSMLAVVFPLPHTASLDVVVGLGEGRLPGPADLPPLDAIERGWAAHFDNTMRVDVPDERVPVVVSAARRHLLSGAFQPADSWFWTHGTEPWAPAVAAAALHAWGHGLASRELLFAASGWDDLTVHARRPVAAGGSLLWAWAERLEREPDPDLEAVLAPWVEEVAVGLLRRPGWVGRRREPAEVKAWRAVGLASSASLLSRWGDEQLGPDIVDALPSLIADIGDGSTLAVALAGHRLGLQYASLRGLVSATVGLPVESELGALAARADATGAMASAVRSQDPGLSALVLLAVRRAMVNEPAGSGGPIALLEQPDPAWMGGTLEVHDAPVAGGSVAFGVRWHGQRPALLWDITNGAAAATSLTVPGLDPDWIDDRPHGEALLAPTPGLELESGPESAQVRRGEAVDIDPDGDSFS